MNNTILWKMPVLATGLVRGPHFRVLPKRDGEILFSIEAADGTEKWLALFFKGIETYKCTYLTSLATINRQLRTDAYETLISVSGSHWLSEVNQAYQNYYKKMPAQANNLHHLMICFDDGPCYELICIKFDGLRELAGDQQIPADFQTPAGKQ